MVVADNDINAFASRISDLLHRFDTAIECDNQIAFDDSKYPEGKVLAFVCPQCGAQFKIKLGRKVVRSESGQEKEVKEPDFS